MLHRFVLASIPILLAQASLAQVTVSFLGCDPGGQHPFTMSSGNPVPGDLLFGIYRWQDDNGPDVYETVCIDLEQGLSGDTIVYESVPLTEARAEPYLTSGPLSPFRADLLEHLWGQYRLQATSNETAIAFHLAVYEIVYDGDSMTFTGGQLDSTYDFEGGIFEASDNGSSTIWALAKSWILSMDLGGDSADLIAWKAYGTQDQITDHFGPTGVSPAGWGEIKSLFRD